MEIPYETHTCTNTRSHKCQSFPHIFIQTEEKTQEEQPSLSQPSLHHFIIISRNGWSPQVRASTAQISIIYYQKCTFYCMYCIIDCHQLANSISSLIVPFMLLFDWCSTSLDGSLEQRQP